jgi:hypothetical protein
MTATPRPPPRLMGISVPKSGTHLLTAIFDAMGYRTVAQPKAEGRQVLDGGEFGPQEAVYFYGHWRCKTATAERLAQHGLRTLLLLRDPRDIWLSMADYLQAGQPRAAVAGEPRLMSMPLDEIRRMVIEGFERPGFKCRPIRSFCEGWKKWQDHGAVVLRYEAIGQSVASGILMKELLAVGIDPAEFLEAARRTFRPTGPASGAARWRHTFDDELRALWKEHATGVASSFGYEELGGP